MRFKNRRQQGAVFAKYKTGMFKGALAFKRNSMVELFEPKYPYRQVGWFDEGSGKYLLF